MLPRKFGEFLVEEGCISRVDLDRALYRQAQQRRKRIGEILVERGHLAADQLTVAVRRQLEALAHLDEGVHGVPFGCFLVDEGFVDDNALHDALWYQERIRAQRIGEILVRMGTLRVQDLERAMRIQMDTIAAA